MGGAIDLFYFYQKGGAGGAIEILTKKQPSALENPAIQLGFGISV